MPQDRTSNVKITTCTLAKGSYAGYWSGFTFHRGHPIPAAPLDNRWKIRMQGQTDAFFLLRGEGEITHQFCTDFEEFDLSNLNVDGSLIFEGAPVGTKNFYAVAPSTATAAVKLNIIEEA